MSYSSPSAVDILVVGAGPVGLFLANECSRRNLRFRIIESRSGQSGTPLGRLAVSEIGPAGRKLAHDIFAIWTDAVAHLSRESGMSQVQSRRFAEDWIARVQGSLILYAANGDCTPFERTMVALLDLAKDKHSPEKPS